MECKRDNFSDALSGARETHQERVSHALKKVITGDETWVYGYDPETKKQSSQWKRPDKPRPKKARQSRSHVKSMLIIFFDCGGVVHYEFAPRRSTKNITLKF